jgi:hypothetical protein
MLLPDSPSNLEREARSKLIGSLQLDIKDNFKGYYHEISRREAELLEQCEGINIDNKADQRIDRILASYDSVRVQGRDLPTLPQS